MNKRKKFQLFIISLILVTTISSFNITNVHAATVDEWLYVHTDDNTNTDWTEVGSTPFVDAQDQPTNYGWVASKNQDWGNFLIDDTTGDSTVNLVNLTAYCDSGTEGITFWVYDLSALIFVNIGSDSASGGWHTVSYDLSSIITTVAEIDALEVYVRSTGSGGWTGTVDVDYIVIGVNVDTVVTGTDYTKNIPEELIFYDSTDLAVAFSTSFFEELIFDVTTYLAVDFSTTFFEEIIFSDTTYLSIDWIIKLYDEIIFNENINVFIVISNHLYELITFYDDNSVSIDWSILINELIEIADSTSEAVSYLLKIFEEIIIYDSITIVEVIQILVELFESVTFDDFINFIIGVAPPNTNSGEYIFPTFLQDLGFIIACVAGIFFVSLIAYSLVKEGF